MKLEEMTLAQFAEQLAAKTPVPGGGGASALMGALGAALGSMVANYTVGKRKYAAVEEEVQDILARMEELRKKLLELVEEDAAAFEPLSRAYAIPKDDPSREEEMERCLRRAAGPPMELVRLSCQAIGLHQELLHKGSAMILSDVGTGVILCWGALYGGWLNLKVNTKPMSDQTCAQSLNQEADALVGEYWKIAEQVYESVMEKFS
ncbi:cyclodeaminase/cyclohydrolase family protein [Oscillospiraceae bacterium 50-16]